MKRRVLNSFALALIIAGAFGLGMFFMYWLMWVDVLSQLIEAIEKVSS